MLRKQRILSLAMGFMLLIGSFVSEVKPVKAMDALVDLKGQDYYIDSDGGNDSNAGTSPEEAWSTLDKVNSTTFKPGDRLLFENGDVWTGQLSPKGSGEKGNPIIIASYGNAEERPLIQGNNWCGENGDDLDNQIFNAAVYFYNQQYWEITSLEITNRIPGDNPEDHIKKYGVLIMGKDAGTLEHMYCKDLYVHDVVSHPIGQQAGIGRGGIIYIIRGNQIPTNWNDIVVENNKVGPNINHYGINFLSTWGSSQFEQESGIPDSEYAGQRCDSTNIVIRNNYCEKIGNAAICPSAYENALIEYNVCDGCNSGPNGNVPIWWENGEYTVAQYNEVFGSGASESKEDSQAFDADVNATLNYIQYNYTHDNPSGAYFECALGTPYTTHIRYNISQNDGYGTNSYGGGAIVTLGGYSSDPNNKMYVYNNDFYLDEGHNSYITNNWDNTEVNAENFRFVNNVIYSDADSKGWHDCFKGAAYNNAYGGTDTNIIRTDDNQALTITRDDFVNIGTGGKGINSVDGYRLADKSICKESGVLMFDNGGVDYWGNHVSNTKAPNIGCDNSGAEKDTMEGVLTFEDRSLGEQVLEGEYQKCMFPEGWMTKGDQSNKALFMSNETGSNIIQLPENKIIKSFRAKCDGIASLIVSANGVKKTFSLSSVNNVFETGFISAADEVEFTINCPTGSKQVQLDDIVLADAEKERKNIALNCPVETSGEDQNPGIYGNDGNEDTMWIHWGEELGQWWSVDLGALYQLSDFELVFEKDETPNAWKYQIEASENNKDFEIIFDASDNENGSKIQHGDFMSEKEYRYVRVKITGIPEEDYWPAFREFRLYQK